MITHERDWQEAYYRGFREGYNHAVDGLDELWHQAINAIPNVVQITVGEEGSRVIVAQLAQEIKRLKAVTKAAQEFFEYCHHEADVHRCYLKKEQDSWRCREACPLAKLKEMLKGAKD